ncbi:MULTISPECIES: hypothetical protein [unclassified Streptomyces]|uniref:hypothetical protein n=1 Tax=unclassified Streptomyces TaxID=2593676 RepID=UPI000DDAFA81|nr:MULTISPECIES: hypothetical protein [unclassified Streptomyces]QZZ26522.1 hypothetical protein A7X85_09880 [Streptomyces sp. ST1015]
MPTGSDRGRYVPNPGAFRQLAGSGYMHTLLLEIAQRGAASARTLAPSYTGPTWKPGVARHGEYRNSIYSGAFLQANGWRAEFGAAAGWALQVEFGTGRTEGRRRDSRGRFRSTQERPQGGYSPKHRTLGRALDSLRST